LLLKGKQCWYMKFLYEGYSEDFKDTRYLVCERFVSANLIEEAMAIVKKAFPKVQIHTVVHQGVAV
jgi:hypothetical protein